MSSKLKSSKELRTALKAFFASIEHDVAPANATFQDVMFSPGGRIAQQVAFIESAATQAAREDVLKRALRIMGPVASDEKEIDDLLWRMAAERAASSSKSVDDAELEVIAELGKKLEEPQLYIEQNDGLSFSKDLNDLRVGPVRAVRTDVLEAELLPTHPKRPWTNFVSTPIMEPGSPPTGYIRPELVWAVDLTGSIKNIREQAKWLIDIAMSLIRLGYLRQPGAFNDLGECETLPFGASAERRAGVAMAQKGMNIVMRRDRPVSLNAAAGKVLMSAPFTDYAAVFAAKEGSVAERVAQGLGWMTRGRQADDRAERLLYFFTAVEALLTSNDKNAPVTQTIARHASVILAATPADRVKIAGQFKGLYGLRSSLVHSGKRGVSRSDADSVQYLVEALYDRVLDQVPLTSEAQKFSHALDQASYGAAWP